PESFVLPALNARFLQQRQKLIIERPHPMMLLLLHVRLHNAQHRWAYAECAVSLLPFEGNLLFSEPSPRIGFEFLHSLSQTHRWRQANQQVQVVRCAGNGDGVRSELAIDTPDVRDESG